MSLHPKDDALPTATRLRVLVALPLLIILGLFLVYLDHNDWTLRSPRPAEAKQATNKFVLPKRKPVPRPRVAVAAAVETPERNPASSVPTVVIEPPPTSPADATAPAVTYPSPAPARAVAASQPLLLFGEVPVVTGRVTLLGKPPAETPISLDAQCSRAGGQPATTRHFVVSAGGGMADVVVSFKGVEAHLAAFTQAQRDAAKPELLLLAMSRKMPEIELRGCEFVPYMSATLANADVLVRNVDPVLHTARATPVVEGNLARVFNMMPKSRFQTFSFQKPEEFLRIKCDVHPWMLAYVTVFDHPFFDVTDTNGVFRVPLPPPGKYVLQAVHRKAGRLEQEVVVRRGESLVVNFVFELK